LGSSQQKFGVIINRDEVGNSSVEECCKDKNILITTKIKNEKNN